MESFRRRILVSSIISAVCFVALAFLFYIIRNVSVSSSQYSSFITFCLDYFWQLAFLLTGVLLIGFVINTKQRFEMYKTEVENVKKQKLYDKVIEAISKDYNALYVVDLDKNEFLDARMSEDVEQILKDASIYNVPYDVAVDKYVDNFVAQNDQVRMREILSLDSVIKDIDVPGTHSTVFTTTIDNSKNRFREIHITPIDDGSDRKLVAFSFSDVDEKITNEIEKEALKKRIDESEMISSIAQDYEGLCYCNFSENSFEPIIDKLGLNDIPGWNDADFFAKNRLFGEYFVCSSDRDTFFEQTEKESIIAGLINGEAYIINYRAKIDGELKYYQTKIVPVKHKFENGVVIGIYSVDDEKKKELKQNEELKNAVKKTEEMLRAESVYKNAIFANAVSFFQINLTKNIIVSPVWEVVNGVLTDYAEYVGGTFTKYNTAIIKAADAYVEPQYKESYKIRLSSEHLIKQFENGNISPEYTCMIFSTHRGLHYRKYINYLSEDETTGDIMSMCVAYDISDEIKLEEILRSCIGYAYGTSSVDDAIYGIISDIGHFYGASGVYTYEIDYQNNRASCNYLWRSDDTAETDKNFYGISVDEIDWLINLLKVYGEINHDLTDMTIPWNSKELDIFKAVGVERYVAVPMLAENKIAGFMTITNPSKEIEDTFLIKGLGLLAYSEILRRKEGRVETQVIGALGEGYEIVYYVDAITGEYRDFSKSFFYEVNVRNRLVESHNNFFEEIIGNIERVVYEPDREKLKNFFDREKMLESFKEEPIQFLTYRLTINDEAIYYRIKVIYNKSENDNGNYVIGVSNVDTQTRQEIELQEELRNAKNAAEEANNAKSDFLSRMSHDIRTPINGIIGMTEIARMNNEDPKKVIECLGKIDSASHHLLDLINEILDMSKIESGDAKINHAPLNIKLLCDECVSIVSGQLFNRHLNIVTHYENIHHSQLIGDELHIKQILINILGNAVKFTPDEGTITFSVEESYDDNIRSTFRFVVEDTGFGMKPEYINSIYERFSQEDEGARSSYQGTGLGMSITKNLVELLNGKIDVESKLNEGSKFTVTLPLEIDNSLIIEAIKDETIDLNGLNILLAEDNELNAEIAKVLLEHHGVRVTLVTNGRQALEAFKASSEGEYDAILMDIMMPVLDGLAATREIRGLDRNDAKTIPIIAMTANAFEEDKQKSYEAGMNDHVSKPVDPKLLQRIIAIHTKRL